MHLFSCYDLMTTTTTLHAITKSMATACQEYQNITYKMEYRIVAFEDEESRAVQMFHTVLEETLM